MKDGYRYFIVRATAADGSIQEGSEPSYFRIMVSGNSITYNVPNFWDGSEWKDSVLTNFSSYIDDVFRSGAWIREILDEKDRPDVPERRAEGTYIPPQQLTPGGPVHGGWTIVATPPVGGQDD